MKMTGHDSRGRAMHCGYCGRPLDVSEKLLERFGETFCSEPHAEEFVAGVRTARMEAVARDEAAQAAGPPQAGSCALPPAGPRGWTAYLKRAACWAAPLLLLLAIPLLWNGGWVAAGGSLLSVIAVLACPLGMYFMMRGMTSMPHGSDRARSEPARREERRRA